MILLQNVIQAAEFSPPPPIVVDLPPTSETSDQESGRNRADAARRAAREGLGKMIPLAERSEAALSTISQAEIPISSFLRSLKQFKSIADDMAEV